MKCPDCGIEIAALPCERCEKEAANAERVMQAVVEEFSLVRGAPETKESRESLDFALMHLKQHLEKERFRGTVSYNTRDLLRSQRWWYVPFRWIGCMGFIVNLDSGYVNWLGSGPSLSNCFWGHEHGLFCELVDFAFAPDTDLELAKKLLLRFKHMYPNTDGVYPKEPVWYIEDKTRTDLLAYPPYSARASPVKPSWSREITISDALATNFPLFKRHFVWFGIPEIRQAYERKGLRFTSTPSDPA